MDGRRGSPARLLAPIALIAFALALLLVVATSDTSEDSGNGDGERAAQREDRARGETGQDTVAEEEPRVPGRFYTVQTGDTLAAISETVGVSVTRLQELNPELDPQALVSGQRIRLRE